MSAAYKLTIFASLETYLNLLHKSIISVAVEIVEIRDKICANNVSGLQRGQEIKSGAGSPYPYG